jgi:hypothetical protein
MGTPPLKRIVAYPFIPQNSSATFSLTPWAQRKSYQKETPRISPSAEGDEGTALDLQAF